jgi:SAM-dependent methyltransferase
MQHEVIVNEFTHQAESFNASAVANAAATVEELLTFAGPASSEQWVELACGPGIVSRRLAPQVGSVLGIDLTPAMVALARREAAAAGVENATFAVGDATATGLDTASADGALARFAIHHLPVPGRLVEEMFRIVRPGGTIVLMDHVADPDQEAFAWAQEIERLRDPSHWASLTVERLRELGTSVGLTLEEDQLLELDLDFDDWLARGSASASARVLVERTLRSRPGGARCFQIKERDGRRRLLLRAWRSRWRR